MWKCMQKHRCELYQSNVTVTKKLFRSGSEFEMFMAYVIYVYATFVVTMSTFIRREAIFYFYLDCSGSDLKV
jgi:hypothetical protein